jgi:hypothetical protein
VPYDSKNKKNTQKKALANPLLAAKRNALSLLFFGCNHMCEHFEAKKNHQQEEGVQKEVK